MMQVNPYLPEGYAPLDSAPLPLSAIQAMIASGEIAEGLAVRCDSHRNLHILLHGYEGVIPREEALHALEDDQLILDALGEHVAANYLAGKWREWDEYRTRVSSWEREKYIINY